MITLIPLGGFLGAGKTTTMMAARTLLESQGRRVAVITNDQGADLVDSQVVQAGGAAAGEVTGGCFCCRFEDLVEVASGLVARDGADTIITEAVGSCTDLQATVVGPLRRYYGDEFAVAPLTTVVDPLRYDAFARSWDRGERESDLSYLYRHQLGEAELIGLNKIDVVSRESSERTAADIRRRFADATVIPYSATTTRGLDELVAAWSQPRSPGRSLDIDYDRYASAEAELGWLNRTLEVNAGPRGFSPRQWAQTALSALADACERASYLVGHAKVGLETSGSLTKASITAAGARPSLDLEGPEAADTATVTFNARIACDPEQLEELVGAAVTAADDACDTRSTFAKGRAFQPGYPVPVHRLVSDPAP